jgi:glycosyltransferase involved in cell wall biosynthesis
MRMGIESLIIVLPSLNPDEKLNRVVEKLNAAGFRHIVLIDDGSDAGHKAPFEAARNSFGCAVLVHDENRGKGCALKTGFSYVLEHYPHCCGVITVDGDDQHQIQDIQECGEALLAQPDRLVLGVRDFSGSDAPFRSRFGNLLTRMIFRTFCGVNVSDTQTGLRGIPLEFLRYFLQVGGERFEYETNLLLSVSRLDIPIREVKISAVYLDKNASSHFRAIRDSIRVYAVIFPFMLSSIASAIVDTAIFTGLNFWLADDIQTGRRLFAATAAARVISAFLNFLCNHKVVFRSEHRMKKTLIRYAILCALQGLASYLLVFSFSVLCLDEPGAETVYKIITDIFLFFVSFQIQRSWVFGRTNTQNSGK